MNADLATMVQYGNKEYYAYGMEDTFSFFCTMWVAYQ
jgi:hypothetical protein